MFTGIVTAVGTVSAVDPAGDERRITIDAGRLDTDDVAVGDSIAVDGVCLTVVNHGHGCLSFDVSGETLACTTLGERGTGDEVNLEAAMLPTTRLGGHLVSGHVDGVGRVSARWREGSCERFTIEVPAGLEQYIARKGSLCVSGVSLTVNDVSGREVGLNVIPHTLQATNFARLSAGARVNIEVDIIARYLERLLQGGSAGSVD